MRVAPLKSFDHPSNALSTSHRLALSSLSIPAKKSIEHNTSNQNVRIRRRPRPPHLPSHRQYPIFPFNLPHPTPHVLSTFTPTLIVLVLSFPFNPARHKLTRSPNLDQTWHLRRRQRNQHRPLLSLLPSRPPPRVVHYLHLPRSLRLRRSPHE
jgi:hypothetical protein